MRRQSKVSVIIPAFNEEYSIGKVLKDIPDWVDDIIVVDNNSTDNTARVARSGGARVVKEMHQGYGAACLQGISQLIETDIVVFLDGDYSDYPDDMDQLVDPIANGYMDMVIGSRNLGKAQPGSLTPQARFGNWLACNLIQLFWKMTYTDLGPFRAIRFSSLQKLHMQDRDYGWTVEMQIKAALSRLAVMDCPVRYRPRVGQSKISGTIKGVIGAGMKILGTIALARLGRLKGTACPEELLIIFSRYPEPGKTKTRLIPALGPDGAAQLQQQMTEHSLRWARQLQRSRSLDIQLSYFGGTRKKMKQWLGGDLIYCAQSKGDLGQKMFQAFQKAFQKRYKRVLIVGTDCTEITTKVAAMAFDRLDDHDVVLGPAHDGGYYHIGLSAMHRTLFRGIDWGTEKVWHQTMSVIENEAISFFKNKQLSDIDRPEDLDTWYQAADRQYKTLPSVSAILPVLNEEQRIGAVIEAIQKQSDVEVIVVDGGSQDRTVANAKSKGAKVVTCSPGRAVQMNTGAAEARGDILLFLHGDTIAPEGYAISIQEVLSRHGVSCGAFSLAISKSNKKLDWICKWANRRSRMMQLPYGDQGCFLYRPLFDQMNGFPVIPIMEDYRFVKKLKKRGSIVTTKATVETSGRRWKRLGIFKTTVINQLVIIGYYLGIPYNRLKELYQKAK